MDKYEAIARLLRLGVVRNVHEQDLITEAQAIELLKAPLSPDDESTRRDDSHLLKASVKEIEDYFGTRLELPAREQEQER